MFGLKLMKKRNVDDCATTHQQPLAQKLFLLVYRKDRFLCTKCNKWHLKKNKFLWSKCRHEYGELCVKEIIDSKLMTEKSEFNTFDQEIPKCCNKYCGQQILLSDASNINMTSYQYQTLRKMIKKENGGCCVM